MEMGKLSAPDQRYFQGRLLLAMPDMPDPRFNHAAIALCVHDANGAMGIDLSSVIDSLTLRDLVENFEIDGSRVPDMPVLCGGPVEPRRGFILHSLDWRDENTIVVAPDIGLSGSLDILRDMADGRGPTHYVAALGYSGWSGGQLEQELTRPGWFVGDLDDTVLFSTRADKRWAAAFARNGIDPSHLIAQSGHA